MVKNDILRLSVLFAVCCTLCFVSCSGEEEDVENEFTNVTEEVLSVETTPVTFDFGSYGKYTLFDYAANGTYVGSDTVELKKPHTTSTIELRQGKHEVVWIDYRHSASEYLNAANNSYFFGVHFLPESKVFREEIPKLPVEYGPLPDPVFYWKKNINVSPYLLPTQKSDFMSVTCSVEIEATEDHASASWSGEGVITGIPIITDVGLDDNRHKICTETSSAPIFFYCDEKIVFDETISDYSYNISIHGKECFHILCPQGGLDDIQLSCNIKGDDGHYTTTTPLPKISIRRGYTTRIYGSFGSLLSGNASDWKVEMIPYNYSY